MLLRTAVLRSAYALVCACVCATSLQENTLGVACSQYSFFFLCPPFFCLCDQSSGVACSQYLHAASLERRGGALFALPGVQEIEVSERVMALVENRCRQLKASYTSSLRPHTLVA